MTDAGMIALPPNLEFVRYRVAHVGRSDDLTITSLNETMDVGCPVTRNAWSWSANANHLGWIDVDRLPVRTVQRDEVERKK
jgi:hypothetical protein